MNELIQLFLAFAQVGAVTFGGGYAMLPILTRELVDKRGWVTDDELTDLAVRQQHDRVLDVLIGDLDVDAPDRRADGAGPRRHARRRPSRGRPRRRSR